VNAHAFAEDDPALNYLGRLPHPANLAVSWGRNLADAVKAAFKCDAESAASNARIMRTTRCWIQQHPNAVSDMLMVIQWSTWERQEWLIDGTYYQINASGTDVIPASHQQAYKEYIAGIDWNQCTRRAHEEIWQFHLELEEKGIRHVFFNGNNHFGKIPGQDHKNWGVNYIGPYNSQMTFNQWLLDHGHETVAPNSWHFGKAAHGAWSRFVLQYVIKNQLVR
jgi:hypothetical protein